MKQTFLNIPESKQQTIIQGAIEEFGTYGYQAASTNRLVKSLNISKGSLFKYFENKLDLYDYLVDYTLTRLLNYMKDYSPIQESPILNLLDYAALEFDFLIEFPALYRFFYQLQKDLNIPEIETIKEKLIIKSIGINNKLLDSMDISADSFLREHLALVITAYNQRFMDSVDINANWFLLKKPFLEGLEKHLNLIVWN